MEASASSFLSSFSSSSSSFASASSSSPFISFASKKYDVFISFRGEDTRRNFTSHLRDALRGKQIETYVDDRLERGDEISPALSKAIEKSLISVVVFSQNYASSKWCLEELVKIMECRKKGQDVIPVFYNVDPSHVRKQTGRYKDAFAKHGRDLQDKEGKLNKWKEALFEAANLAGWDSQAHGDDSNLIQMIVEDVLRKLESKYPPQESKCTFGIKENLEPIESSFREVRTVGIWGMGGIGKTTIAKWLFNKYFSQYEGSYFLANVREKSGMDAQALCNEVVFKLLGESERTNNVECTFAKIRLFRKKVLLVLDDVSSSRQLKDLVEKLEVQNFKSSSRVIITSRDKHVLTNGGVDAIHEVKELNLQESLQLFSLNAFKQKLSIKGYEELSRRAVDYAKGVPLALVVLGSFLRSRSENEWESALTKLKKIPNEEIQSVLRLSYDGLNNEEKEIFLDIACFLKGEYVEHVISLLDSYDFYASIGLRTLQDKALITVEYRVVWMHNLIQEMGWGIVREESIKEPGRRSRLWDPKEVYDVLKYNKGANEVEGIILDMSQITDLHLSVDTFRHMTKLRFLKFYSSSSGQYSNVHIPLGFQLFSNKLRYFQWNGYVSKSVPLTFCLETLVELSMPDSRLEKLWDGVQEMMNLKKLNLSRSKWLIELPDFSRASNLEMVDLSYCESLCHVHRSILSLHSLVALYLYDCKELNSLESEIHLRSLSSLRVYGCSSLKKFSISSEVMRELDLSDTRIDILPSTIGRFSQLQQLVLKGLRIKNLPNELSCLRNLEILIISNCPVLMIQKQRLHIILDGLQSLKYLFLKQGRCLSELPDNICVLSFLKQLDLSGSNIECFPTSIKKLTRLSIIYLQNCKRIRCLAELPQCITDLDLSGSNIECFPASIKHLTSLKYLTIRDCKRLRLLPELSQSVIHLVATNCTSLETVISTMTSRLWRERTPLLLFFENCVTLDEQLVSFILKDSYFLIKQTAYEIVLGRGFDDDDCCKGDLYKLRICLPERRVPEWFKYNRTTRNSITIGLNRTLKILAFAFCLVLSPLHIKPTNRYASTTTINYFQCDQGEIVGKPAYWGYSICNELNSDHVFLWCEDANEFSYLRTTCNSEVSFTFSVNTAPGPCPVSIKECGVYPIYGLEVSLTSHAEAGAPYTGKKEDYVKVQRK